MTNAKQKLADEYAGQGCYLNGKPAKITGRLLPYAYITALPDGPSYEFAWETVDYIMTQKDRKFRS